MSKLLTIITTTYHAEKYLPLYFRGVLNLQGLDTFLFLLIMNEPSEEEKHMACFYQNQHQDLFQIIEIPERESIGTSLNRGFALVNTPYCSFLDVDDMRVPDSYLRQIETLEQNPDVDFTYGDFMVVRSHGTMEGEYISALEYNPNDFRRGCQASPTQFFRTALLNKIGRFDEQLKSGGDFEFQVRAAFNCEFKKTPGLMCYYTRLPVSSSASSDILQPLERTMIELRYGMYDKTETLNGYQYVYRARRYRLFQILLYGEWHSIENFVPDYWKMMAGCETERKRFEAKYKIKMFQYYALLPFKLAYGKLRTGMR